MKKFRWNQMGLIVLNSNKNLNEKLVPKELNEKQVEECLELGFKFYQPTHHITLDTYEKIKPYIN